MRIALLTFESFASAEAVRRFVDANAQRIALVALSDPLAASWRREIGRSVRMLRRAGPRLIPYLVANFLLPRLAPRRAGAPPEKTPLARLCHARGIPCVAVPDVNHPAFQARLAASGADLIVTFHCDQILAPATIAVAPLGGINVHPGLLSSQRGPTPTIAALAEAQPRFAVTLHRLVARIDAGPVLAEARCDLPAGITALAAARHLHLAAAPILEKLLDDWEHGDAPEPAPGASAPGPYHSFPTWAELRALAAIGRKPADWRDLAAALRLPA